MMRDNKPIMLRVKSKPEVLIGPWGAMENKMRDLPPGPDMHSQEKRLRTGWMFLPSEEMNCKIETFEPNDFRHLPKEKSNLYLG